MTADEARELFSDAYDGALAPEQKEAFEAALAADAELRAEYEALCELLDAARDLAGDPELSGEAEALRVWEADDDDLEVPDLLRGVQAKIRERSGGRFYRDRFAERQRGLGWMPLILALVLLLVLATAYIGLAYVEVAPSAPP